MKKFWSRFKEELWHITGACRRWQEDDGALLSASVAYYVGLSFFPLLLVLIAGFGLFLTYSDVGQNAEGQVLQMLSNHLSPALKQHAQRALENIKGKSLFTGPIALVGILITSIAGFAMFERAFNHIWRTPQPKKHGLVAGMRRILRQRGAALLMLLVMGTLVVCVFLTNIVLTSLEQYASNTLPQTEIAAKFGRGLVTVFFNVVIFTLLYRWLPRARVRWKDAIRGAVLATVGWEIGRHLMTFLVVGNNYASAYGLLGTFIAIQLWCYYAIAVVFLGAEYIQEFSGKRPPMTKSPASEDDLLDEKEECTANTSMSRDAGH